MKNGVEGYLHERSDLKRPHYHLGCNLKPLYHAPLAALSAFRLPWPMKRCFIPTPVIHCTTTRSMACANIPSSVRPPYSTLVSQLAGKSFYYTPCCGPSRGRFFSVSLWQTGDRRKSELALTCQTAACIFNIEALSTSSSYFRMSMSMNFFGGCLHLP